MNFNNIFDFTVKPVFKELEDNNKLLEYSQLLEREILNSENIVRQNKKPKRILETMNNIQQYEILSEYNDWQKLLKDQKEYLKVLKEIETELNEYLEEVVKKMRDNLKL